MQNQEEGLDRERIEALALQLLIPIRDNYDQGPVSRDRCFEALNALAFCAAHVIAGCQGDALALEFFMKAFHGNREDPAWTRREGYLEIEGAQCLITLEPRPHYCDRGNWIAKLITSGSLAREIDDADAWPRYYFDLGRAKAELEAWLTKRGQLK
jgi:hypothetical protein